MVAINVPDTSGARRVVPKYITQAPEKQYMPMKAVAWRLKVIPVAVLKKVRIMVTCYFHQLPLFIGSLLFQHITQAPEKYLAISTYIRIHLTKKTKNTKRYLAWERVCYWACSVGVPASYRVQEEDFPYSTPGFQT